MKGIKNEHVDVSFIFRTKMSTPRTLKKVTEKTTVIHGWVITILSLVFFVFRNNNFNVILVQRKSVLPS